MRLSLTIALLVAGTSFAALAAAHPAPLLEASCAGEAPATTACTTGTHPFLGLMPRLGCGVAEGYVGTVLSVLSHAGGSFTVSCTQLADGTREGDAWGSGTPPALLEAMQHDCSSHEAGTAALGGSGHFLCTISH